MIHLARIKLHRNAKSKPTRFKLRGADVDVTKIDRWIKAERKKLGDNGFMSSILNEGEEIQYQLSARFRLGSDM